MPAPYGHQQGGTRRKKNRKGMSNSRAKERKMMRGGKVLDVDAFWKNGGIVSRKKSPMPKIFSASTVYKMIWIPSSELITFDLTPLAVLNLTKIPGAKSIIIETMNTLIKSVFNSEISGLLDSDTLSQTVICFSVKDNIIISGTKTINGDKSTDLKLPQNGGSFDTLKQEFAKLNIDNAKDTINLDVMFPPTNQESPNASETTLPQGEESEETITPPP